MLLKSLTRLQANEARLREILLVLGKYGLADWLGTPRTKWLRKWLVTSSGQRLDQVGHEERIRLTLLELGTTFVKLGQMLSTRPDLIGPTLAAELSKLQSSTPADTIEVVRHTITAELGRPPEELFAEFSAEAMASASIGQVHRARLPDGQAVVVKVQHAGIEATIQRDLMLMLGLAELAQKHVRALRSYRPVSTVREFRRTLLRELDLRGERRHLEEFSRHFAKDTGVYFPKVYPALSGRRVLTMELLEGIPGTEASKGLAEVDSALFVQRAATMYLDMIFRDGFYHADPHPGNYVILPGSVVGVLDCGMVGRLDDVLRDELEGTLLAVAERDVQELTERVIRLGSPPADLDREALRVDLAEFVADYGSRPIKELELRAALGEMIDIIARYRIALPSSVSLLLRTLMILEGSARQLDPTFSLMDLIVKYRTRAGKARLLPGRWLRDLRRMARGYDRLLRLFPEDASDILHRLRTGRFELKHEHRHLQASVHRLVQGLLTASLLLSSALLLSRGEGSFLELLRPGLGLVALALAGFLGFRLLRSIRATERKTWE
jgi:ubiquinone biosynthesis protein